MRLWALGQLGDDSQTGTVDAIQAAASEWGFDVELPQDPPPADSSETCHLWPENLLPWECWHAVQTQWRMGMGGATGLDYTAVLAYLKDGKGLPGKERREVFGLLQLCERETLRVWAEKRERDTTK